MYKIMLVYTLKEAVNLVIIAELNLFFVVYDSYNNFPGVQLRVIVLPVWAKKHYTLVCLDLLMLESQVANYNLPVHLENTIN